MKLYKPLLVLLLVLGFTARLYKIDRPVADWHSWRQADTAAVTRIYADEGVNMLYPKYYDISSAQTGKPNPQGYRFVEFPIYNLINLFLYKSYPQFTLEKWGRVVSIFASLISGVVVYLIGRKTINEWVGIISSGLFLFLPFNIFFSTVILPEPLMVLFGLLSIYFFIEFLDKDTKINLIISSFFLALALLLKPFMIFYSIPMILLYVKKFGLKKLSRDIYLALYFFVAFLPFITWRIWVSQFPYAIPHFIWMFDGDRLRFRPAFWRWIFGERLGRLILGVWGIPLFVIGILKHNLFINSFLLSMFSYVAIVATANVRHDYYQVLTIPAICIAVAYGIYYIWNAKDFNLFLRRGFIVFSLVMAFGLSFYQTKEFYNINNFAIIKAGEALDMVSPKDARVIAPYNDDTAFLYQTKRYGWPGFQDSLDDMIKGGASYYVSVNKKDMTTVDLSQKYKVIKEENNFIIIDLKTLK